MYSRRHFVVDSIFWMKLKVNSYYVIDLTSPNLEYKLHKDLFS